MKKHEKCDELVKINWTISKEEVPKQIKVCSKCPMTNCPASHHVLSKKT